MIPNYRPMMAALAGTGRLADDLYLLAHHDVTGKPYLQPRAVGLGLAGALLGELALCGAIWVRRGELMPVRAIVPDDGLARQVLAVLAGERDRHPPADWLSFLAATASHRVAARLVRSGYLMPACSRRPWRGQRWVPVDPDCAFAPVVRARAVLDPARRPTTAGTALAGLAAACGLGPRILQYGQPGARQRLDAAVCLLTPDLRELVAHTQAAVDAAVLSPRA